MFVAIRGEATDGNQFVFDAIERGASRNRQRTATASFVGVGRGLASPAAQRAIPPTVEWVRVPDARKALAIIGANFYGQPADRLELVGITGTNGKTTTSFLVDSIVRAAGAAPDFSAPSNIAPRGNTARRRPPRRNRSTCNDFLLRSCAGGGTHAVLEASSHALALDRLWGCRFAAAVFTNLTRDHLDFHRNIRRLFCRQAPLV